MEALCSPNRDTLLFSGGGLKALAFCGALERLYALRKDAGKNFRVFAGVSAGGALSMCLALGHSPRSARRLLEEDNVLAAFGAQQLSLGSVLSGGGLLERAPLARILARWINLAGLPADISFRNLRQCTGTILRTAACTVDAGPPKILIIDDVSYPDLPVLRGILASMAVPFMFDPVEVQGRLCVDPCVINNLCIFCCEPDRTIAFVSGNNGSGRSTTIAALSRLDFLSKVEARAHANRIIIVNMPTLPDPTYHLFRVGDGSAQAIEKLIQQGRDAVDSYSISEFLLGFIIIVVSKGLFRDGQNGASDETST